MNLLLLCAASKWLLSSLDGVHGAAPKPKPAIAPAPPAESAADKALPPLCSLDVSEMDPGQILQTLSMQTHTNLVLLAKPESKLTIHLEKVPLPEMVRHICAMCQLSYLAMGNTYVIANEDRLKTAYPKEWDEVHPKTQQAPPPEKATEVYRTNYVSAEDLSKTLEKLSDGKGVLFSAGPNPVTPEIGSQDSSKTTGTSTTILSKSPNVQLGSRMLVITGPKDSVAAALALAKQLDQPRRQVSIAVSIYDMSNNDVNDLGVAWTYGSTTFNESQGSGINFGSITRTPLSFSAALSALDSKGRTKLLASPNVSVLDGERAFVLIGDRINYPVLVGYTQTNAPIFSKEEERVGIYLQVSATISDDGAVTLSLYPQVSTITSFLSLNGASYPQISTREAQTTIRVDSGKPIVMGGLFSDEDVSTLDRVPLLSQIPFLGALFQHRKVTKTKSQVIIVVTPTVIGADKK
jgi:type II secretory pathway component HofQ